MFKAAILFVLVTFATECFAQSTCPTLEMDRVKLAGSELAIWKYRIKDGPTALVISAGMSVNADGAKRAYAVYGQHGLSYLCDGASVSDDKINHYYNRPDLCAKGVAAIDQLKIVDGKVMFPANMPVSMCIFGFEVAGTKKCHGGGAVLVGAGEPATARVQADLKDARGNDMPYFYSTTSERNRDGSSLDAAKVPFIVQPRGMSIMRQGEFGYVVSDGTATFDGVKAKARSIPAVVGDIGPADKFGEGSIALHQFLAYGKVIDGPAYDPQVCQGKDPSLCSVKEPYTLTSKFPYPYVDKRGGDVRAKTNWPKSLLYILFPDQQAQKPDAYTFQVTAGEKSEGTIADGAAKAAAPFGGIDAIVECVRRQKSW